MTILMYQEKWPSTWRLGQRTILHETIRHDIFIDICIYISIIYNYMYMYMYTHCYY
jgi:hypothetical protein